MTRLPKNSETSNKTKKTPNRVFAIPAAAPAIVDKPKKAAANAMIRKKTDQDNRQNSTSTYLHYYIWIENKWQFMIVLNVE
jgi:hypothetical protein